MGMIPMFAFSNKPNCGGGYSEEWSYAMAFMPFSKHRFNFLHLFQIQLCASIIFTFARSLSKASETVKHIFGRCCPFQILKIVVMFNSILVIYLWFEHWVRNESQSDESVNGLCDIISIDREVNAKVSLPSLCELHDVRNSSSKF
jgi:hypothetical protein